MAAYPLAELTFLSVEGDTDYSTAGINHQHFCARCGTSTYSLTPDWSLGDTEPPDALRFSINIGMFDDLGPATVEVQHWDGRHLWREGGARAPRQPALELGRGVIFFLEGYRDIGIGR